jgi:hypothetical protein
LTLPLLWPVGRLQAALVGVPRCRGRPRRLDSGLRKITPWAGTAAKAGAKHSRRPRVVLTREEARAILHRLTGDKWLIVSLLYGSGLRLMECLDLRAKDLEFSPGEVTVRDGQGGKGPGDDAPRFDQYPTPRSPSGSQEGPRERPCRRLGAGALTRCTRPQVSECARGVGQAVGLSSGASLEESQNRGGGPPPRSRAMS